MDIQICSNSTLDYFYGELSTSKQGLSSKDAKDRLKTHGKNLIPDKDAKAWFQLLLSQFTNPLILLLIFASLIAGYIGDFFETIMEIR